MGDIELQVFSDRLKKLRLSLNMTQKDFAGEIGITASALSSYEKNLKNPSIAVAKKIAEAFHVSIDWLCGLSDKESSSNIPQTLADIFEMLFLIQEYSDIQIYNHEGVVQIRNKNNLLTTFQQSTIHAIGFQPFNIDSFIEDWQKMNEMYLSEKIDEEVYALWKEKTLKKTKSYFPNGSEIKEDEPPQE